MASPTKQDGRPRNTVPTQFNNHPDPHPKSPLLTVEETADYLRGTVTYVYRVLRYEIPTVKTGKRVFFERPALDAFIANSRTVGA